jgi:hypothetical protein
VPAPTVLTPVLASRYSLGKGVIFIAGHHPVVPTFISLESNLAQVIATAAGSLSNEIAIASESTTEITASGSPSVLTALGAAAAALSSAAASISNDILLYGSAAATSSATATATTQTSLAGSASANSSSSGVLSQIINLAGSASAIASAVAAISQSSAISGAANVLASAAGEVVQAVAVASTSTVNIEASGNLNITQTINGEIIYAVNLKTGAITTLTNFNFNRLVRAHGKLYGLKSGKLYRIEGTKDPDNTNIDTILRFSSSNLGVETIQRLNKIYIISRYKSSLKVTPIYDEVNGIEYYSTAISQDGLVSHRVSVGKNNKWNTIGLQIENINGEAIDIGGFELLTNQLSRRIP